MDRLRYRHHSVIIIVLYNLHVMNHSLCFFLFFILQYMHFITFNIFSFFSLSLSGLNLFSRFLSLSLSFPPPPSFLLSSYPSYPSIFLFFSLFSSLFLLPSLHPSLPSPFPLYIHTCWCVCVYIHSVRSWFISFSQPYKLRMSADYNLYSY